MAADTYLALPDASPAPAIVLLPPIFGIEPVICSIADHWATRGFVVLALNQFRHDAEPGPMERTPEGRARAMERGKRVDVEQLVDDVRSAIDDLRAMPACNGKVGAIGFCFGGRYAFLAAGRLPVEAAAGFHPTQIPLSIADAARVRVPLSLHFGADDPLTPKDDVDAITASLRHRADAEIFVYPRATHNFAVPGVPGYDPAVAELSEQRAFTLFDRLKAVP
jgi:carboxymethylenebutenolidase